MIRYKINQKIFLIRLLTLKQINQQMLHYDKQNKLGKPLIEKDVANKTQELKLLTNYLIISHKQQYVFGVL
jgi:hypothetical protein